MCEYVPKQSIAYQAPSSLLKMKLPSNPLQVSLPGGVSALSDEINEKRSIRQPDGGTRHPKDLSALKTSRLEVPFKELR